MYWVLIWVTSIEDWFVRFGETTFKKSKRLGSWTGPLPGGLTVSTLSQDGRVYFFRLSSGDQLTTTIYDYVTNWYIPCKEEFLWDRTSFGIRRLSVPPSIPSTYRNHLWSRSSLYIVKDSSLYWGGQLYPGESHNFLPSGYKILTRNHSMMLVGEGFTT